MLNICVCVFYECHIHLYPYWGLKKWPYPYLIPYPYLFPCNFGSFGIRGVLNGQWVITLLDTRATHNFIDEGLVARCGLKTEEFEGFKARVADGFTLKCNRRIPNITL